MRFKLNWDHLILSSKNETKNTPVVFYIVCGGINEGKKEKNTQPKKIQLALRAAETSRALFGYTSNLVYGYTSNLV